MQTQAASNQQPFAHSAWQALEQHFQAMKQQQLSAFFESDPARFSKLSFNLNEILFDFSKNPITNETVNLFSELAQQINLQQHISDFFTGKAVNTTEQRAALHMALRQPEQQAHTHIPENILEQVWAARKYMLHLAQQIREGQWHGVTGRAITNVVNIGVGGSGLGPELICKALQPYGAKHLNVHFIDCMDGQQIGALLPKLDPETSIFIITSKSFTTIDTLSNAKTVAQWFERSAIKNSDWQRHLFAISANLDKVTEFGIPKENCLEFWDWVGGRFSVWSSVGFVCAIYLGANNFLDLLQGAHLVDQHFLTTEFSKNIPCLLAMLTIWYVDFFNYQSHAILPYDSHLARLPAYLQQLHMESCGKQALSAADGGFSQHATGEVIWGELGPTAQHAFYQLLHQGSQVIPCDFIVPVEQTYDLPEHKNLSLANAIAQSSALMVGKGDVSEPHTYYPGNRPSTFMLFNKLTPSVLGSLLACYEHKVFVQSVLWSINPFDQYGVELGKVLSKDILELLAQPNAIRTAEQGNSLDPSTLGILKCTQADNFRA